MKLSKLSNVFLFSNLLSLSDIVLSADVQNQNIVKTIRNQKDLDDYLNLTGEDISGDNVIFELSESIKFPKKRFFVRNNEVVWSFKGTGKPVVIDFGGSEFLQGIGGDFFWLGTGSHGNIDKYTVIKNGHFYGSTKTNTSKDGHILDDSRSPEKHKSIFGGSRFGLGMFMGQFLKASYISFEDMTFNNVHHEDGHVFDLSGSEYIRFYNNKFAGYAGREFTDEEIRKRFSVNHHFLYSEAIQIDSALKGTFGNFVPKGTILENVSFDNKPSSHLLFEKNLFTTYSGLDAEGMIQNDNSRIVVRNYSSGLGSHTKGNGEYKYIIIKDNKFVNTINFKNNIHEERHLMYPIHFEGVSSLIANKIFISGNIFEGIESYDDSGKLIKGRIGVSENNIKYTSKVESKDLNFNTKYVADINKDFGYKATTTKGVLGRETKITEYQLDPESGQINELPPVVSRVEPVNEIVSVGTKSKFETKDLNFSTKYVADINKDFGYKVTTTKGILGRETKTIGYKLDPESGQINELPSVVSRVEPVNEIVSVGFRNHSFKDKTLSVRFLANNKYNNVLSIRYLK